MKSPRNPTSARSAAEAPNNRPPAIPETNPAPETNPVLSQFDRLIADLIAENMQRSKFEPWEIDILLDILACGITKPTVLKRYREAVHRQMASGAAHPMKLSEFLAVKTRGSKSPAA